MLREGTAEQLDDPGKEAEQRKGVQVASSFTRWSSVQRLGRGHHRTS